MRTPTILAAGLAALALAGCGGGGNNASSNTTSTETTTSSEATGTTTTTSEATTTEAGGLTTPNFASRKCRDLAQSAAKIGQDISAAGASGNLQDVAKEFHAFVSVVPSEIKGDVQTIADAFTAYADALKGVNLSAGQTPSAADLQKMQSALKSFDQQKVQAAEQRIEAWTKKNC